MELLRKIAMREGIGDLLAEGTREVAKRIGHDSWKYAINVKGLEVPAFDPRGAKGHGLGMATSPIGADHNTAFNVAEQFGKEAMGKLWDRFATDGKGELVKYYQDHCAATETGILCHFPDSLFVSVELYTKIVGAVTGVEEHSDPEYVWMVGERIFNLERMFNAREGLDRKDDMYPPRITEEVLLEGASEGVPYEEKQLLDDYYKARGWDIKTGLPTPAKLKKLGLDFTLPRK